MDTVTGDPPPHPLSLRVCTCGKSHDAMAWAMIMFHYFKSSDSTIQMLNFTSSAGYEVYSFCYRHCLVLDSVAIFLYKARRWCIWSHNISNGTRQCSLYNLGSALTQPEARPRPRLRWPRRRSLGLRGATVSVGLRRQPAPHTLLAGSRWH